MAAASAAAASAFNLNESYFNDKTSESRYLKNLNFVTDDEISGPMDYVIPPQEFQRTITAFKHFTGPHPAFFHIDLMCNIYFTFELVCFNVKLFI